MNFRNKEIMSKNGSMPPMSIPYLHFTLALQDFRDWYQKPMNINCWYRDTKYNEEVGGDKSSNHLVGTAVDWNIVNVTKDMSPFRLEQWRVRIINQWIRLGQKYGYNVQIEINDTWLHLAFGVKSSKNFTRIGINKASNTYTKNLFMPYYGLNSKRPNILDKDETRRIFYPEPKK